MARELSVLRQAFAELHADVSKLLQEVHSTPASLKLVLARHRVQTLEKRLEAVWAAFSVLEAELLEHAEAPMEYNSATRHAARFSVYASARDSVRGLLETVNGALGSLQNQLDFRGSLIVALVGLVIAVVALFV